MMLTEFSDLWNRIDEGKSTSIQRRIDSSHPLNLFFGYDPIGSREFIMVTEILPNLKLNSASIDIETGIRRDKQFAICFRLIDIHQEAVFVQLCWDLFEHTRDSSDEVNGIKKIQNRFKIWQKLFDEGNDGLLSIKAIKGLVGELIFLKTYACEHYGIENAVKSWIGPHNAHKDYWFESTWYEIKTIDSATKDITISSLEQLASEVIGFIVCMIVEKTSKTATNRLNLPFLVDSIRAILNDNEEIRLEFDSKLIEVGYFDRDEYYNFNFAYIESKKYIVDKEFPKITSEIVDDAITEVKYKISLASIRNWLTE